MKKDYVIARHRIRIEGEEQWVQAVAALDGFKPFEVAADEEPLTVWTLTDEPVPAMTDVQYESAVDGYVNHFGRYENGYLFTMTPPEGRQVLALWKRMTDEPSSYHKSSTWRPSGGVIVNR